MATVQAGPWCPKGDRKNPPGARNAAAPERRLNRGWVHIGQPDSKGPQKSGKISFSFIRRREVAIQRGKNYNDDQKASHHGAAKASGTQEQAK